MADFFPRRDYLRNGLTTFSIVFEQSIRQTRCCAPDEQLRRNVLTAFVFIDSHGAGPVDSCVANQMMKPHEHRSFDVVGKRPGVHC